MRWIEFQLPSPRNTKCFRRDVFRDGNTLQSNETESYIASLITSVIKTRVKCSFGFA